MENSSTALFRELVSTFSFKLIWWCNCVELLILLLDIFFGILVIIVVSSSSQLHKNLMDLLRFLAFNWLLSTFCRVAVTIGVLFRPETLAIANLFFTVQPFFSGEWARMFFIISVLGTLPSIALERMLATFRLDVYEKQRNVKLVVGLFAFCYLSSAIITFLLIQVNLIAYIVPMGVIGNILFICFFTWLGWLNRRRFRAAILHGHAAGYTLSQRFQISENIRSLNLLNRFLATLLTGSAFIMLLMIYEHFIVEDNLQIYILRAAFNLMISLCSMAVLLAIGTASVVWRTAVIVSLKRATGANAANLGILSCKNRLYQRKNVVPSGMDRSYLKTADGVQMAFGVVEEQEIYFANLKKTWS